MKRVMPSLILLVMLSGCAGMKETGMSVGGSVHINDGFLNPSFNIQKYFKKKQ